MGRLATAVVGVSLSRKRVEDDERRGRCVDVSGGNGGAALGIGGE